METTTTSSSSIHRSQRTSSILVPSQSASYRDSYRHASSYRDSYRHASLSASARNSGGLPDSAYFSEATSHHRNSNHSNQQHRRSSLLGQCTAFCLQCASGVSRCCCSSSSTSPFHFLPSNSPTVLKCRTIIRSRWWKFWMILFYSFLLFSSPMHHIWAFTDELTFDILSYITVAFCIMEMLLCFVGEPNYFQFQLPFCNTISNNNNNNNKGGGGGASVSGGGGGGGGGGGSSDREFVFSVGSFLFWCDILSTTAVFFQISSINSGRYAKEIRRMTLDEHGYEVGALDELQRVHPVDVEIGLLVTIARCARLARFVRSRTIVNAGNRINWYWPFQNAKWLNPFFYWKRFQRKRRQAQLDTLGGGGANAIDESNEFEPTTPTTEDRKTTSWGELQVGVLAAVRAQAEEEAQQEKIKEEQEQQHQQRKSIWQSVRSLASSMRFKRGEHSNHARQVAAIKIQRAWRAHVRFEAPISTEGSILGELAHDDDSNSFMRNHGSISRNALDKVPGNREALASFARMNARAGGRLDRREIKASFGARTVLGSRFQSNAGTGRESQVGTDMRARTGQWVATGVLTSLVFTVIFTYADTQSTWRTTMQVLHMQTMNELYRMDALYYARNTTCPEMYFYKPANSEPIYFPLEDLDELQDYEKIMYTVSDASGLESLAEFSVKKHRRLEGFSEIAATLFVIVVWFFGVTAFAGPVMSLVVIPIERMVRLLEMLMMDPLGYESTQKFKNFLIEEDDLIKNTRWTRKVLKGMETSFLMDTILRIGSLMKVGFGTAGVEIIQNNLQKGQSKNLLILTTKGSTVSCIFLFCDIRQFTDATECLQEEVFVFTNRIAAVVHSICHSYGGAANKNVGDAFLLSWSLEDMDSNRGSASESSLVAKSNQADKALLSVIKICISLYYDQYYLEPLSETASNRLKEKLKKRSGPVVQMGFGLHAGKAVQGAIGSQRKIDATYVSEAVERAEFLESSTKKYGLQMLMSGNFHRLLHPNTRRRCRKIDRILLQDAEDNEDEDDDQLHGELMELFTFDMDVSALHRPQIRKSRSIDGDTVSDSGSVNGEGARRFKKVDRRGSIRQVRNRRRSISVRPPSSHVGSEEFNIPGQGTMSISERGTPSIIGGAGGSVHSTEDINNPNLQGPPELVLPKGPALYSHNIWQSPDMKRIRDKYVQGLFFQKFQAGLQSFYAKDWDMAQQCFQTVLDIFDDGPSKYFMEQILQNDGVPPKDFLAYGLA